MALKRPLAASFAASFVLLVAGACGLTGVDDALQPVPSDGIGNFGTSQPIEVCLGPARITSPSASTGASAVCVRAGSAGAPCAGDARCDGIERCICGRCIVEACQGVSACGTGKVCRQQRCTVACSGDVDCDADERCVLGGCARVCGSDGACHHGERCDALEGVCAAKLCSATVGCGAGDTCEAEQRLGELHEPTIVTTSEGDLGFVELREVGPSAGRSILRARVEAPGRWRVDPEGPVLPIAEGVRPSAPALLAEEGRLALYFAEGDGAAIRRAISTDGGRSFATEPGAVLTPAEGWEGGWVGSPSVVVFQGRTLLFYEGGPRAGIGGCEVAGGVAKRLDPGPIVSPSSIEDPLFWRGMTEISAPFALVTGDALRLYFTGRGADGGDAIVADASLPAERNDSIGLVASRDGATFTRSPTGPVFARIANLRAHLGEREASVRLLPGGAEITFVASDAAGSAASGLAHAGR